MDKQKIQQISIKGVLCKDNKVLVLKTPGNRGIYELPGGRMDFGEAVEGTFVREMKEELGFTKARLGNFINAWTLLSDRSDGYYHFIILDFEMFTDENDIKISLEHIEYKWIGADEIDAIEMHEGHKKSLRKYFENQNI